MNSPPVPTARDGGSTPNPAPIQKISEAVEELQAHARTFNHLLSLVNSMSLKCAVQLGIADAIHSHGTPMSLPMLAAALSINQSKATYLGRLMRLLVHSQFFYLVHETGTDQPCYALTEASRLLLKDNPHSLAPFVLTALEPAMIIPWDHLGEWFRNEDDATPFVSASRVNIWDYRRDNVEHFGTYNSAMACDSHMLASKLTAGPHGAELFRGVETFVDVGGGTGAFARSVAAAFPRIECIVLDLPHVVAGLEEWDNLKFVGGDMFDAIPCADALLLKWIFPAFGDEESVKLLKQCRKAITKKGGQNKRGKVIIIDMVVEDDKDDGKDHEATETKLCSDLVMMLYHKGGERSQKKWAKLFSDAGFSDHKITPCLGLRSIIEVYA